MKAYAATLFASEERGLVAAPEHVVIDGGQVWDDRDGSRRIDFGEFCAMARRERVDLGARGFYATPGVDYNRDTGRGNPFFYYTTGAAVAEVTVDRFTGELTFDRGDLLMDIGRSLNPGIDRGQVIGGFIQGVGWVTDEDLRYDDAGRLLSTGPTTYKIPNVTDLPRVFNVAFLDNPKHQKNVRLSKAVGEPPLMLGWRSGRRRSTPCCRWPMASGSSWRSPPRPRNCSAGSRPWTPPRQSSPPRAAKELRSGRAATVR